MSNSDLWTSTDGGALLAAAVLLVLVVLPAEYGLDYTGFGRVTGLTSLARAKAAGAAPPGFWPPAGNYAGAQTVTISSTSSGATIYYTTDGSTPTAGSPSGA